MVLAVGVRGMQDRQPRRGGQRGKLAITLRAAGLRVLLNDPDPDLAAVGLQFLQVADDRVWEPIRSSAGGPALR